MPENAFVMSYLFRYSSKQISSVYCSLLIHTSVQLKQIISDDKAIVSIINSLHEGVNWKTLTQKFESVGFSNLLIQKILLKLKESNNSRKALNLFHWSAKDMHFQHDISSYCMMIHILVKGRLIKDAKALLETALTKPSPHYNSQAFIVLNSLLSNYEVVGSMPIVFDLFVRTCAKLRMVDDILGACELLIDYGFQLNVISFNTLLHVMQTSENAHLVWGLYRCMISTRTYPNEETMRIMIRALCKEGKLEKFLYIVDSMHGKRCSISGLVVNTRLVYETIEKGSTEDGLMLLKRMLQKNMILDTVSFCLVVFAKVKMGDLVTAEEIHQEMLKRGFPKNAFVCSLLIGAYCEEGRVDRAVMLLEEMETLGFKPLAETFNLLMKGCCTNGRLDDSLTFCKKMLMMGLVPSCSAVNEMIGKLCENRKTKEADEILTILLDKGLTANEDTFSHLIDGYCRDGDIERAIKLVFEMEYRSLSPNMLGFTSLIISHCKFGRLKEADKYLEMMKSQSFVPSESVYEDLIFSHLRNGDKVRAHKLNCEMAGTHSRC